MYKTGAIALFLGMCVFGGPQYLYQAHAQSNQSKVDELRAQISDKNAQLAEIEKEIAQYQDQLTKVGAQKDTLRNAIAKLELEKKKVQADISYTQNKIGATDLQISQLGIEIQNTEQNIATNEKAIAEVLRQLDESDQTSMIETLLTYNNLSEFWGALEDLQQVRNGMGNKVDSLTSQKKLLESARTKNAEKRDELVNLKQQYTDQNQVLASNKADKTQLLTETNNKESKYQELLAEKKAAKDKLQKEVIDYESQLKFILDPNTIPPAGTVVFNWPLKNIIITQLFGGTEFAQRNASVYGGRPYHNGVDFGASVGTPIYAPLAGTVRATGNTDAVPGCYSWGKWTLVDHANGLSTLYAHQSVISVKPGDHVNTGQVIGYTGNTGYTTGPHLHFTVYVTAAVEIHRFSDVKKVTGCGAATSPFAALSGYLDPMLYLPKPPNG